MEMESIRTAVLKRVSRKCLAIDRDRVIVAVDGVDGSGKTTFADELANTLSIIGHHTVRVSVDGFHHPRAVRYRQGRSSPSGYFQDSFDYNELKRCLLLPFRLGASTVETARFDYCIDQEVTSSHVEVDARSILLLDGIFLHRDELRGNWDVSVFLDVPFPVSFARMSARDGPDANPQSPANVRYFDGQKIYLGQCKPGDRATFVIDNADLNSPRIIKENTAGNSAHSSVRQL